MILSRSMQNKKRLTAISVLAAGFLLVFIFCLPAKLFNDPYSTVLKSDDAELLSATIARDGQWRFPQGQSVPGKFSEAIITFEDKRFYHHFGVDVLALGRAIRENISNRRIVSGGSTITMQVIRLSRKGKPRTFFQKLVELALAMRLELRCSKAEILSLYAAHAPFGGNVVGLEAACWRYFGRDPNQLSWGEAALLAVLPNAPSLMHPGKNREGLKEKRDYLLDKLVAAGKIDQFTASLAKEEYIPDQPQALPRHARHLLTRAMKDGHYENVIASTIDKSLQLEAERIIQGHHQRLAGNQIHNAAALILDVRSGKTLAYVGNIYSNNADDHSDVDAITAPRSTGSILKPFLFAAMLDEGKMLSGTLLPDVPTIISGFAPKNFSMGYDGAVAADKSLIRSLNIPAVHMLKSYRYEKFHSLLRSIGMTTLNKGPDHYGLSLILGGAEGSLWDITGMYASMARTLKNFRERPGINKYNKEDFHAPFYVNENNLADSHHVGTTLKKDTWISAAAIYQTFDALKDLYRPGEETGWRYFSSSKKIAWKTGTSFGFRDGWAVGITPNYVVGVWVGNADGEGRPGLTGTEAAAPIMFDLFSILKEDQWFYPPSSEMQTVTVCKKSGYRNSPWCEQIDTVKISRDGLQTGACPFHKIVHLSANRKFRVHNQCAEATDIVSTNWFVLPPMQEYYFRQKNFSYQPLPAFQAGCQSTTSAVASMDLIYPKNDSEIFIPRELNGSNGKVVFELAHSDPRVVVYWHLDGNYIGATSGKHNMRLNPAHGRHLLTIVDEHGESINHSFSVISYM